MLPRLIFWKCYISIYFQLFIKNFQIWGGHIVSNIVTQLFSKFYDLCYCCGYFIHKKRFLAIFEMSQDLLFLMNMSLSTKVYDTEIPVSTYMRTPIWQTEISWQERCRNFFLCPTILKTVQTAIFYKIYQKGFLLFLIHFCSD